MASPGVVEATPIARPIDEWLTADSPTVDQVAQQLRELRRMGGDLSLAEAHLVTYVREKLDLSDVDDDPTFLVPEVAELDE